MLSDFQTFVADLVRDDASDISDVQRDKAITAAVLRYSKDAPVIKMVEVIATGGNFLNLPAEWIDDFSQLQSVEYPVGNVPPNKLSNDEYDVQLTPTGKKIAHKYSFSTGAKVWLEITVRHTLSDVADTIPIDDREAVCCLAGANLCDQLATKYSGDTNSSINADSVNHQSKAAEYAARARALRKRYTDELGIDTKRNKSACAVVAMKNTDSRGRDRLTHGTRFRRNG